MYTRARKLSDLLGEPSKAVAIAELEVEALSITLNALSLLDVKSPWLVVPSIVGSSRVSVHLSYLADVLSLLSPATEEEET